jgi:hypothetical protein
LPRCAKLNGIKKKVARPVTAIKNQFEPIFRSMGADMIHFKHEAVRYRDRSGGTTNTRR